MQDNGVRDIVEGTKQEIRIESAVHGIHAEVDRVMMNNATKPFQGYCLCI